MKYPIEYCILLYILIFKSLSPAMRHFLLIVDSMTMYYGLETLILYSKLEYKIYKVKYHHLLSNLESFKFTYALILLEGLIFEEH